ncbi:MAG: hypothetical protein KAJ36_00920, partial [Candidatus Thorarchaeota archaeon]|nr:hypothetical protein [Candidatus Thorarchaeota archaeon]
DSVCLANAVFSELHPMHTGGQTNCCMYQKIMTCPYKKDGLFLQNASFSKSELKHGPRLGSECVVIGLFWQLEYAIPMRF